MAKRRLARPSAEEEEEPEGEQESPKERRERRERERRAREKRGSKSSGLLARWPRWKTLGAILGVVVAIVAAVAIVVIYFPTPCLSLAPPPASSGVPDESAPSWCVNSTVSLVERMVVHLTITVAGKPVTIPGGIGEISATKAAAQWQYSAGCTFPVFTDNGTGPGGGDSGGYIQIASPWAFTYTIGDFFNLWKESDSTATVNGASQPVSYTGTQLFNYSSSGNQIVRLWVDGQVSSAGTGLVLNYLVSNYNVANDLPQCIPQKYGSDHSIVLTWGWTGAGMVQSGPTLFQAGDNTAYSPGAGPATGPSPPGTSSPWSGAQGALAVSLVAGAGTLVLLGAFLDRRDLGPGRGCGGSGHRRWG